MPNTHVCHVGTIFIDRDETIFIDRDETTVLSMVFCAWVSARLIVQHEES